MGTLGVALAFPLGGDDGPLTPDELEVEDWLIALWPPGVRDLYDLGNPRSDVSRYFAALAQSFRKLGTAMVDKTRRELQPATCVEKLPDWEAALGITASSTAASGTTTARQAAVVAKLRESGSYSLADLRAILGPLLGYADASQLQIIECPRSALAAIHTFPNGAGGVIAPGASLARQVLVPDTPAVSIGGVRVRATFSTADLSKASLMLSSPGGAAAFTWPAGSLGAGVANAKTVIARSHAFDGVPVGGPWQLTITNDVTAPGNLTLSSWDLFVEGVGHDPNDVDGLGAQIFHFSTVVDPALAGATHATDLDAARAALSRTKPAHTRAFLVRKMTGGSLAAICDDPNAIASACVCG